MLTVMFSNKSAKITKIIHVLQKRNKEMQSKWGLKKTLSTNFLS